MIYLILLQLRSTPLGPDLSSPATLSFNYPIRSTMLVISRALTNANNADDHYKAVVKRQTKADKKYDTLRNYNSIPIDSTTVPQQEDG